MATFDCDTSPAAARTAGIQRSTPPYVVAIIFKACCYETGLPKTWLFTNIDQIAIVQGRVHLLRHDYGLVCDLPYAEVAQVYATGDELATPRSPETRQAINDAETGYTSAA